MSAEAAFLAAVRTTPYAALTRLVYADWLDDHDRPDQANYLRWQAGLLADIGPDDLDPVHDLFRQFDPVEAEMWRVRLRAFDPAWVARVHLDFAAPPNLPPGGAEAVACVVELLAERGEWDTDGAAPAFRAPAKWLASGGRWPEPNPYDVEDAELYGFELGHPSEEEWAGALLVVRYESRGCLWKLFWVSTLAEHNRYDADAWLARHGLRSLDLYDESVAILPARPG